MKMSWGLALIAIWSGLQSPGQTAIPSKDVAAPSARFPAEWYPADNDYSYTTPPIAGAPYSGMMVATGSHAGVTAQMVQKTHQMRDGAGRLRTETVTMRPGAGNGGLPVEVRVIEVDDPVSHCRFQWAEPSDGPGQPSATVICMPKILHYSGEGNSEISIPPERVETHPMPRETMVREPLGTRVMEGLEARGVRVTTTEKDDSGKVVREVIAEGWVSSELRETLQTSYAITASGTRSELVSLLTEIHRGEPDAALFYPPAGYTIVKEQ